MYQNIVFLHSYDDFTVDQWFNGDLEIDQLFQHLIQWDYGESGDTYENPVWGLTDSIKKYTIESDTYILSYNNSLQYVGLCRIVK